MRLFAISIYRHNEKTGEFERSGCVTDKSGMFSNYSLDDLENNVLVNLAGKFPESRQPIRVPGSDNENYYFKKYLPDNDDKDRRSIVIAIASRDNFLKQKADLELNQLFENINHIRLRPKTVEPDTYQTILNNPQNYIGRDLLRGKIQADLKELKAETSKIVDSVIQRGQKIEILVGKSANLLDTSIKFKDKATDLRKKQQCCRYW